MRISIFVMVTLLGACAVDGGQEHPVDAITQPQLEAQQGPGAPRAASAEQVERMEAEMREQRAAIELRASRVNLPELLEQIKATPDGPERRMLVGEYITAAHYADKVIGAKAMRELDEAMAVR